jgi:hypothetical protein
MLIETTSGGVTTVTELLELLVDVQLRQTATTSYVYVPSTTPVSSQLVGAAGSRKPGELPQAALVVAPSFLVT